MSRQRRLELRAGLIQVADFFETASQDKRGLGFGEPAAGLIDGRTRLLLPTCSRQILNQSDPCLRRSAGQLDRAPQLGLRFGGLARGPQDLAQPEAIAIVLRIGGDRFACLNQGSRFVVGLERYFGGESLE